MINCLFLILYSNFYMQSTYTQNQKQIIQYFLQPTPINSGSQMLQAIKNNENFPKICSKIGWIFSESSQPLITLDKDYVMMNICQKLSSENSNSNIQKLSQSVQQLEQLQMKLDCLISQLQDKTNWIKNKSNECKKNKEETSEDCQILTHQNMKLINQYQISQKQNKNQQNMLGKGKRKMEEGKQLGFILDKYRCDGGFPKNKNQTLRLLNNLEVMIQKLEVQKLSLQ